MDYSKITYTLVIVLLYIPLVFMGANVFFPKFTGSESYYSDGRDCYGYGYGKYPAPVRPEQEQTPISQARQAEIDACVKQQEVERKAFETEKLRYESFKYVFIVVINIIALLIALFITLKDSIVIGLFLGSVVTTFIATIRYFETKSKIGFALLVIMFALTVYFINRRKGILYKIDKRKR